MATTYRVNEIFYSLQGEGFHSGTPAVFVRFSGCNLACPFCDTDFAAFSEMTAEAIADRVEALLPEQKRSAAIIVLTGGEPALQVDAALLAELHSRLPLPIHIETNGTHPLPADIDWVTCSPKAGSEVLLQEADEVKVVYTGTSPEPWHDAIRARQYFLQPCSCANTEAVVSYILAHPWWRLSLQTHKYTGIR